MTREEILEKNASKRTKCEVYTRVMGYFRPTHALNVGKKGEHAERVFFNQPGETNDQ